MSILDGVFEMRELIAWSVCGVKTTLFDGHERANYCQKKVIKSQRF